MEYGIWSLLPPILAIVLAIKTRQVYISLMAGIFVGWTIVNKWNPFTGLLDTVNALVDVFADAGNTRTIIFCMLVGSLIVLIQRSGGVEAFIDRVSARINKSETGQGKKKVQLYTWLAGMLIFVESNISLLTVGTIFRPLFDRFKISREKLAYISDSSSAPACVLIPINAWGAFAMGLIALEGYSNNFELLVAAIPYNFYAIIAILIVLYTILSGKDIGPMVKAQKRTAETGKLHWDDATPMVADEITSVESKEGAKKRVSNMLIPIIAMIVLMPIMLIYTGWGKLETGTLGQKIFNAMSEGSGSAAVMYAIVGALLVTMILYKGRGIMGIKEMVEWIFKGLSGMVSLAALMVMAFAINAICRELGTGQYVADVAQQWLSPALLPMMIFIISCFVAFSTGTSWGTFGIMMAIAIPLGVELGISIPLCIAAVLGGGVFGDHCSPISDTTIIASMSSATDHIDHVRTQLPYALIGGGLTCLLYLIFGVLEMS